jgi:urease gamma subunit
MNSAISIINNKIYNANKDAICLSRLRLKYLDISKNDILKNVGCAIKLFDVRSIFNDPSKIVIK